MMPLCDDGEGERERSEHDGNDGKRVVNIITFLTAITVDIFTQVAYSHNLHMVDSLKNPTTTTDFGHAAHILKVIAPSKWDSNIDMLDRLLDHATSNPTTGSDEEGMTDPEIIDAVVGMFFAGHETTTSTLGWLIYELSKPENAHVRTKLEEEVDEVLSKSGGRLTWESLASLKYTEQTIKETLRLHTIVPTIGRTTPKDQIVNGYFIPAGTRLSINARMIHRNPVYWPNPLKFQPERFGGSVRAGTFLPFGDGPMK
ncbi:hypothetical protein HK102_008216, partial [Quaeritorhiza haematococci]